MKFRDLEKHMQEQLSDHPSPVNTDALWANLQARRRRRRGFWLWFAGAALLLMGLGWSLWAGLPEQETVPNIASQEESVEIYSEKPYISAERQEEVPSEQEERFMPAGRKSSKIRPSLAAGDAEIVTQTTSVQTSRNRADVLDNNSPFPSGKEKGALAEKEPQTPSIGETSSQKTMGNNNPPLPSFLLNPLPTRSFQLHSSRELPLIPPVPSLQETNRQKDFTFGLNLEAALLSANRDLSARSPQYESLEEVRDLTEKSLESLQFSLLGRVTHRSGLYLRAGAAYTRIAERFDFNWTQTRTDSMVNGIQEIIIFPNGDTSLVEGMVQLEIQESYRKRHYNYHHLIDLPVILGYSFGRGPLGLDVEGGVFFNLSMYSTGEIWGPGDAPIVIEETEPAPFRKSLGLSYYGSFRLRYEASPALRLYLGPQFRYFPAEFSAEGYPLRQEYQLFGLQAGATYLFD